MESAKSYVQNYVSSLFRLLENLLSFKRPQYVKGHEASIKEMLEIINRHRAFVLKKLSSIKATAIACGYNLDDRVVLEELEQLLLKSSEISTTEFTQWKEKAENRNCNFCGDYNNNALDMPLRQMLCWLAHLKIQ